MKRRVLFLSLTLVLLLTGCSLISNSTETTALRTLISPSTLPTTHPSNSSDSTTSKIDELNNVSYESLFDNRISHRFTISFSQANFDKLIDDMQHYYDEFGTYRDNTIQEVDILYEDSNGNSVDLYEVGFRTKGNIFSRFLPVILSGDQVVGYQQVSFQLEFNETFDYLEESTPYKNLKQRRMFDLEQLNFKFIRPEDTGIVTEMVAYDLFLSAGIPAPQTSLAVIYFDIEGTVVPYGLFTVTEPLDDVFVRRTFGKNSDGTIGDLYKCVWQEYGPATLQEDYNPEALGISDYNLGYRRNYQLKTNKTIEYQGVEYPRSDFTVFSHFINQLNQVTNTTVGQNTLESILDVDLWLKTLALSFLIGNPDDYRFDANNYYMYFYENQAVYIPFDFDQSLGYGWDPLGNHGLSLDIYTTKVSQTGNFSYSDLVLVNRVLSFSVYQDQYEAYLLEYSDPDTGIFNVDIYVSEFLLAKSLYESELINQNHLGVRVFDLFERSMNVQTYYSQKIQNTRAYVNYYQDN